MNRWNALGVTVIMRLPGHGIVWYIMQAVKTM